VPLLKTSVATPTAIAKLSSLLEDSLAERTMVHAVLMDVLGLGVLIAGESGIGKSECALDLIVRGHRLVADDTVEIRRRQETILIGACPELTRHHMELRGLGVINVKELFGIASTRSSKRVELVVQLERWDPRASTSGSASTTSSTRSSAARAAHPDAGGARPQHRDPRGGRGAQPAAARAGITPRARSPSGSSDAARAGVRRPRDERGRGVTEPGGAATESRGSGRAGGRGEASRAQGAARRSSSSPAVGLGKSQAIRALEDLGYFCVDNLPTTLIPTLAKLSLRRRRHREGGDRRRRPRGRIPVVVPEDLPQLRKMRGSTRS
jgi:hypothetical protein